ncbi:MAG: PEP-CTERM sorting domain-containing protein [Thermoguttaceae bacterium]|nr:PEP-CTERM sorting domain-containing protein [Thermoguttaceae bacterium]
MKSSVKNGAVSASPTQRILTQGRLAAALLGLCVFTADSTAAVVERYNASGTLTASGTDVATVQKEAGAAEGDVIVISGTATHNSGISQTLENFTIRSAEAGVKQTINAGNTRLYNINNGVHTYHFNFQDLDYQGYANPVSNAIGLFIHTSPGLTLNINTDNVSFTGFKAETHHGGVLGIDGSGNLNITARNGLVFDSNRTNASTGGAIHVNTGSLNISGDSLTFRNNYAKTFGGAIYGKGTTSITGNSILFENNSVANNDGGAIQVAGTFSMSGTSADSVVTFNQNNSRYMGGALSVGTLTLRTGTFNFTGNYNRDESSNYSYGGAVACTSIETDAKVINFDSNTSKYYGGALYAANGGTIKADTILFNKNDSLHFGGAIRSGGTLTITGKNVSFTQNCAANNDGGAFHSQTLVFRGLDSGSVFTFGDNYAKYYGGAIYAGALTLETGTFNFTGNYNTTSSDQWSYGGAVNCTSLAADASVISFDSNTSRYYGGALSIKSGDGVIQADTLTFSKNTASNFGGAVYAEGDLTFAGDDTVGTFTDNTAGNGNGNDLYLAGASSVLTFQDAGAYSFDGGIVLAGESAQVVIDQAQVAIAGRENDSTNIYQLRGVTVSNGGKLTADLTEIDSFSGVFNVGTADSAGTLELNVREGASQSLALSDTSRISGTSNGNVTKTGDGTLQINAPQDSLNVDELTVSAGRLDLQGSMTGGVAVGTNSVFSPGISVGEAVVDGEFKLDQDAVLLLEQDANGMDLLKADSFDVELGSIELELGLVLPDQTYPIIQNTSEDFGADQDVDFWTSLLTSTSAYSWDLAVVGNTVYATIDANAVPEPSAWMLLLVGSFGLLYWRKKK